MRSVLKSKAYHDKLMQDVDDAEWIKDEDTDDLAEDIDVISEALLNPGLQPVKGYS